MSCSQCEQFARGGAASSPLWLSGRLLLIQWKTVTIPLVAAEVSAYQQHGFCWHLVEVFTLFITTLKSLFFPPFFLQGAEKNYSNKLNKGPKQTNKPAVSNLVRGTIFEIGWNLGNLSGSGSLHEQQKPKVEGVCDSNGQLDILTGFRVILQSS